MSPGPKGQGSPVTVGTMADLLCRCWDHGRDKPLKRCLPKLRAFPCSQALPVPPHPPILQLANSCPSFDTQPKGHFYGKGSLSPQGHLPVSSVPPKCHFSTKYQDRWVVQFPHETLSPLRVGGASLFCVLHEPRTVSENNGGGYYIYSENVS